MSKVWINSIFLFIFSKYELVATLLVHKIEYFIKKHLVPFFERALFRQEIENTRITFL